ncbi:MAG: hypothetical protein IIB44_11750 [Candidatus Marinimicrobia bacterium]|nr:hypothetical protein [Candidatus Neomarinimicrobiota bacterium]
MEEKIQIIKDDEIDLRALAKVIWAGRRFIFLFTGAFTLLGVIYALLATPYFKSTITLYPATSESGGLGQLQGLATTFGVAIGGAMPGVVSATHASRSCGENRQR